MSGFSRTRTVFKLVFDDPDLNGLIVKVRKGSIRDHLDWDLATAQNSGQGQVELFAKLLVEWNVTGDDGEVLPLTADSLWSLEKSTFSAIVEAWLENTREVDVPLEQPSSDGALSEVASIPTETLSESLAS